MAGSLSKSDLADTDILQWIDFTLGIHVSQELPWSSWLRENTCKKVKNILHPEFFMQRSYRAFSALSPSNEKLGTFTEANCHFFHLSVASEQFKEFFKFEGQFKSPHKFKSREFKLHWKQLVLTQFYQTLRPSTIIYEASMDERASTTEWKKKESPQNGDFLPIPSSGASHFKKKFPLRSVSGGGTQDCVNQICLFRTLQ